ncbi:Ras association domain-containing protein 5, partial [Goodea atripinnis]
LLACRSGVLKDPSMTVSTVLTPSMTSSNSMSSGYCSLDDESEDFTFFTAKTSFFRKPKHAPKITNQYYVVTIATLGFVGTQSETKEEEEGGAKELSEEEVRAKIESYNAQVSENGMNLAEDGSFTGFIKVHLRLSRPVTVEGNQGRAPLDDQDGKKAEHTEKRTSFYLPCDCVKQIHIGSLTTTSEVIQGLLKKFLVLDDPRKFALYRQTHRDGQDLFQKLPLSEHPLVLRLIAGPDAEQLTFVLKENETGEVEWHAFSVPELQNFLVILEKEEAERVRAVQQKYTIYRQKLQQALQQHGP